MNTVEFLDYVINREVDIIEGEYHTNHELLDGYTNALMILMDLQAQGKCKFHHSDPFVPYEIHSIDIEWTPANGTLILSGKEMAELLKNVEYITYASENEWELSSVIYTKE